MEISILAAENVPPGCLLSLSPTGASKRQAPLKPRQKFAWRSPGTLQELNLNVISVVGAGKLCLDGLKAAGPSGTMLAHEVCIEADAASEIGWSVAGDRGASPIRMLLDIRRCSSTSKSKSPVKSTGQGRTAAAAPCKLGDELGGVASEGRRYLEQKQVLQSIEKLLRELMQVQPKDPWAYIASRLPAESLRSAAADVAGRMRTGTLQMAQAAATAAVSAAAAQDARTGLPSATAAAAPVRTVRFATQSPSTPRATATAVVQSCQSVQTCESLLDARDSAAQTEEVLVREWHAQTEAAQTCDQGIQTEGFLELSAFTAPRNETLPALAPFKQDFQLPQWPFSQPSQSRPETASSCQFEPESEASRPPTAGALNRAGRPLTAGKRCSRLDATGSRALMAEAMLDLAEPEDEETILEPLSELSARGALPPLDGLPTASLPPLQGSFARAARKGRSLQTQSTLSDSSCEPEAISDIPGAKASPAASATGAVASTTIAIDSPDFLLQDDGKIRLKMQLQLKTTEDLAESACHVKGASSEEVVEYVLPAGRVSMDQQPHAEALEKERQVRSQNGHGEKEERREQQHNMEVNAPFFGEAFLAHPPPICIEDFAEGNISCASSRHAFDVVSSAFQAPVVCLDAEATRTETQETDLERQTAEVEHSERKRLEAEVENQQIPGGHDHGEYSWERHQVEEVSRKHEDFKARADIKHVASQEYPLSEESQRKHQLGEEYCKQKHVFEERQPMSEECSEACSSHPQVQSDKVPDVASKLDNTASDSYQDVLNSAKYETGTVEHQAEATRDMNCASIEEAFSFASILCRKTLDYVYAEVAAKVQRHPALREDAIEEELREQGRAVKAAAEIPCNFPGDMCQEAVICGQSTTCLQVETPRADSVRSALILEESGLSESPVMQLEIMAAGLLASGCSTPHAVASAISEPLGCSAGGCDSESESFNFLELMDLASPVSEITQAWTSESGVAAVLCRDTDLSEKEREAAEACSNEGQHYLASRTLDLSESCASCAASQHGLDEIADAACAAEEDGYSAFESSDARASDTTSEKPMPETTAELEAKQKGEEEARVQAELKSKRKAEEEVRLKVELEAKQQAEAVASELTTDKPTTPSGDQAVADEPVAARSIQAAEEAAAEPVVAAKISCDLMETLTEFVAQAVQQAIAIVAPPGAQAQAGELCEPSVTQVVADDSGVLAVGSADKPAAEPLADEPMLSETIPSGSVLTETVTGVVAQAVQQAISSRIALTRCTVHTDQAEEEVDQMAQSNETLLTENQTLQAELRALGRPVDASPPESTPEEGTPRLPSPAFRAGIQQLQKLMDEDFPAVAAGSRTDRC